jgi:hypothetical protein
MLLKGGFGIGVLCFIRVEEVSGSIPGSPHFFLLLLYIIIYMDDLAFFFYSLYG